MPRADYRHEAILACRLWHLLNANHGIGTGRSQVFARSGVTFEPLFDFGRGETTIGFGRFFAIFHYLQALRQR